MSAAKSVLILLFSFTLAYVVTRLFEPRLEGSNPDLIENPMIGAGWVPELNFWRVGGVLVLTLGFAAGFTWLERHRRRTFRAIFGLAVLGEVFFGRIILFTASVPLDSLHDGEKLSETMGFLHGRSLYDGVYFVHGAWDDILRQVVSYAVLGGGEPSIAVYRMGVCLEQVAISALTIALLAYALRGTLAYMGAGIMLVISGFTGILAPKFLLPLIVLGSIWVWFTRSSTWRRWPRWGFMAGLGFVVGIGLQDVIDGGAIALGGAGLACLVATAMAPGGDSGGVAGTWRFARPRAWRWGLLASGAVGVAASQLVTLALLGTESYSAFLRSAILETARYQGRMWGRPMPDVTPDTWSLWMPLLLLIVVLVMAAMVVRLDWRAGRSLAGDAVALAIATVMSIAFLRFAYSRPDEGHVAYVATFIFVVGVLAMDALWRRVAERWDESTTTNLWAPALFVLLLVLPSQAFNIYIAVPNAALTGPSSASLAQFVRWPSVPDSYYYSDDQEAAFEYIREATPQDGSLYVLSTDNVFYYATGLDSPSRFYFSWFTDAAPYEDESLAALQANPPAVVVYSGLWDDPDGISMAQRLPKIDAWIQQNYPESVQIGDYELRIDPRIAVN